VGFFRQRAERGDRQIERTVLSDGALRGLNNIRGAVATTNKLTASDELEGLSREEKRTIDRHSSPSAALVHETIRAEGEAELHRSNMALALSGVSAGLSIGMSLVTMGLIRQHLPDAPWRALVTPLGYASGFFIVVLGRQQLFTENTLTPILPLLYHRKLSILSDVARLWGLVFVTNILATWVFATFLAKTSVFEPATKEVFAQIGAELYGKSFVHMLLSGLMAGWLISLMVWLLPAAGAARPWIVILMTYLIGLAKLSHSIAGSAESFYLVAIGQQSLGAYFGQFLIPTVIGNILGGVTLVAVLNYGQVAEEIHD
jgi:formate/nitrite transporter FocA (FNT family)